MSKHKGSRAQAVRTYRCDVSIDVDATSPTEAARLAWDLLTTGGTYPCVGVRRHGASRATEEVVDLDREGLDAEADE